MIKKLKLILRLFTPPFVNECRKFINRNNRITFKGKYTSWEEALIASKGGYDSPAILEKVKDASLKVKKGEAIFERDSVCFYEEDYRWPLLSSLLFIANSNGSKLKVLDFGGSLGSFYNQHKKYLRSIKDLKWYIVEQENFVECGKSEFQSDVLRFKGTISECLKESSIDVVLLSSVIQYLQSPYSIISDIFNANPDFILIDRTPYINEDNDMIKNQHIPQSKGGGSYPSWFFSKEKFLSTFKEAGYECLIEFDCDEDFGVGDFKGMFFGKC